MNLTTYTRRREPTPFDRMFENFFRQPLGGNLELRDPASAWAPTADVGVDKDNYVFRFDIPGVTREDIDINVEDGVLTVSGERSDGFEGTDESSVYRRESFYGSFTRSFKLPPNATAEGISASYKDGVLTVTVPKAEEVKARKIAVS